MMRRAYERTRCRPCETLNGACCEFAWNHIPVLEDMDLKMTAIASCIQRRNDMNDNILIRRKRYMSDAEETARQLLVDMKSAP